MKSSNILLLIISVLAISVWSCKPKQVIVTEEVEQAVEEAIEEVVEVEEEELEEAMECAYSVVKGKGKITRMNFSNPDNVVIMFEFTPEKGSGLEPTSGHLFNVHGVGKYPPRDWCDENGVEQGAVFKVEYNKLLAGDEECEEYYDFVEFRDKGWK